MKKMSLENRITLAQNNAIDFTHACMTIALHEVFGLGRERLQKVNKRRNEVNGEVLRIMAEYGRPLEATQNAEAWLRSRLPGGHAVGAADPERQGRGQDAHGAEDQGRGGRGCHAGVAGVCRGVRRGAGL